MKKINKEIVLNETIAMLNDKCDIIHRQNIKIAELSEINKHWTDFAQFCLDQWEIDTAEVQELAESVLKEIINIKRKYRQMKGVKK